MFPFYLLVLSVENVITMSDYVDFLRTSYRCVAHHALTMDNQWHKDKTVVARSVGW